MKKTSLFFTGIAAAALLGLSACASYSNTTSNELTDANIAAIVVAANKIDISAAELALKKSKNAKVIEFAMRMIEDHNGVLGAAVDLVTRLGVTPVNDGTVASLTKQAAEHEAKLNTLSGAEFDSAYMNHEVAYHKAVIDLVGGTLIPGTASAELKQTLESVMPAFDAHLAHSEMIAKEL